MSTLKNRIGSEPRSDLQQLTGTTRQQAWASDLRSRELARILLPGPHVLVLSARVLDDYGAGPLGWRNSGGAHVEPYSQLAKLWYPHAMCSRTAAAAREALERALLPIYQDWLLMHDNAAWWLDHRCDFVSGIAGRIPWARVVEAIRNEMADIVRKNMCSNGQCVANAVETAALTNISGSLVPPLSPVVETAERTIGQPALVPEIITLQSSSLLSRWGFDDGSSFACVEDLGLCDASTMLCAAVLQFLMPQLRQKVAIEFVPCAHNPVRAFTVDGKDVTNLNDAGGDHEGMLTPEIVVVSGADVLALANSLHDLVPN